MTKERNSFKAGLFIIITMVLIIGIIIGIEGFDRLLEPVQERTATFKLTDNLGGLGKGDDVRLGGVKVGKIKSIRYTDGQNNEPGLAVDFTLPEKFKLYQGTQLAIETSVTGASNLNISSVGAGSELDPSTPLVGRASSLSELLAIGPDVKAIVAKAGSAVDSANVALAGFKDTGPAATSLVKKVEGKIDPAMQKYDALADSGTKALTEVGSLFGEGKPDFKGTLANLHVATGTLKDKLPGILTHADKTFTKVQSALDSATVAMEDIKTTAANARDLTGSARGVLLGNRGKLDGIIASLKTSSDNVKGATSELRRSPWRLLYKPAAGELDNLVLFESAREFAEGANDLNDAVQSLRDAVHTGNTPPEEMQKKLDALQHTFDQFNTVEQKLWKTVKD